jgi:large-conductance mechanosensitive channel
MPSLHGCGKKLMTKITVLLQLMQLPKTGRRFSATTWPKPSDPKEKAGFIRDRAMHKKFKNFLETAGNFIIILFVGIGIASLFWMASGLLLLLTGPAAVAIIIAGVIFAIAALLSMRQKKEPESVPESVPEEAEEEQAGKAPVVGFCLLDSEPVFDDEEDDNGNQ